MPAQTTNKSHVYIPDGCEVAIKESGGSLFSDVGVVLDEVVASLTWTENDIEYANAEADTTAKEFFIEGSFTLANLDPDNIEKLGNGIIEKVTTAASPVATIPDQTISSGWADQIAYPLVMETSSSDSTTLKTTSAPTLTSVTLDPSGSPEVLVEDTEYVVVADSGSSSGWSIQFISANITAGSPTTFDIEIEYDTNTPVATTTLYAGTTSLTLAEYQLRFTHTDDNSLVRQLNLFSAVTTSGGLTFSFKPVTDDSVETIPVTFKSKIDTSLTDGRQLMSWVVDSGAS